MIYKYIILFIFYSFLGWLMEVIGKYMSEHKFINRGFLIGPYCPIYGMGWLAVTIFLKKYIDDFPALFTMSIIIFSFLEYLTSYLMEKIFKARWWDYSQRKFNINGRICLETMIPFGLLGCFVMYIINPIMFALVDLIPFNILKIISIIIIIIFISDNIISLVIISNFKTISSKVRKDNTEEITTKVRNILLHKNILHRRLVSAFPNIKVLRDKGRQKIEKIKKNITFEKRS